MSVIISPAGSFADFVAVTNSIGRLKAVYYFIASGVFTTSAVQAITHSGKYASQIFVGNTAPGAPSASDVLTAYPSAIALANPPSTLA